MGDFMERAKEALTNEGNRWTPEEGTVLAGTLVRIRQINGQWGDFRVAVIRPLKGGAPVEVAEKTALKEALDEMEKHGPGCQVALKFLGRRQNKSGTGQQYEAYTSYVEPAESVAAVTADLSDASAQLSSSDSMPQPAPAAAPYASPGAGIMKTAAVDPTPEQANDAATLTTMARAALEVGNQDEDEAANRATELAIIGAKARKIGLVWDRTAQCYNAPPAPAADAVL